MIYAAYTKSSDRGIARGIVQGTRTPNPRERIFFDTILGVAYVLEGETFEDIKIMHPSNMGGDLTYFIHLLPEHKSYKSLEEILELFLPKKEEKAIINKPTKSKKG